MDTHHYLSNAWMAAKEHKRIIALILVYVCQGDISHLATVILSRVITFNTEITQIKSKQPTHEFSACTRIKYIYVHGILTYWV